MVKTSICLLPNAETHVCVCVCGYNQIYITYLYMESLLCLWDTYIHAIIFVGFLMYELYKHILLLLNGCRLKNCWIL